MKIMFVCTANTCRSVMAEAIFKHIANENFEVFSSGIIAENGKKPSNNAIEVCNSHAIDLSGCRATYFKDSMIAEMDLVLTLEEFHKEKIMIYYPDLKIFTIREFIGEYPYDINDPFGGDIKVYDACFCEIYRCLKKVMQKLQSTSE